MNKIARSIHSLSDGDSITRRRFVEAIGIVAAATVVGPIARGQTTSDKNVPLGLDTHSLRAMGWKAHRFIEYAAQQKLDAVLFNSLKQFESLDSTYLRKLKELANRNGIRLYVGVGGVAAHSTTFSSEYGSPEELLALGVRVASDLGSPIVNCRIGGLPDRSTEGGIEARIAETVKALKAVRHHAENAGLKFGVENHAGDMRSEELLGLIESVGTDVAGVMLDPGNAVWAMEDPMRQIQLLGSHVVCTSVRDWMVWPTDEGAMFQWTAIGQGLMDVPKYVADLQRLCPGVPLNLEIISNSQRPIPFMQPDYWKLYPHLRAEQIIDFLALCRRGHSLELVMPPANADKKEFERKHQQAELERSIAYLREHCPVGRAI